MVRERTKVPTFITTLALLTVLSGTANLITNGFPVLTFPEWYGFLGSGYLLGIPVAVYIFAIVFATIYFLMEHTTLGRSIYAVGGNMEAARLSGIKVWKVKTIALAVTSGLAALSGLIVSSQIMSGTATSAKGWEMDVISAVIIGGTSLFGGKGKIVGTLIGVVFLGFMSNGMTLMNLSEYIQMVVKGCVILAAVLFNTVMEQRGVSK
jgi:sugar transport system permease protein